MTKCVCLFLVQYDKQEINKKKKEIHQNDKVRQKVNDTCPAKQRDDNNTDYKKE